MDKHTLRVSDVELTIDLARGARATQWLVGDLSLLAVHGPDAVDYGMYPMGPWAGRLRDNAVTFDGRSTLLPVTHDSWALHGTVLGAQLELVDLICEEGRALLTARASNHEGWPWQTEIDVTWELRHDELVTTIEVRTREGRFPVTVGWHPWFSRRLARGDELQWSMNATRRAERGADHLPTGSLVAFDLSEGPFDDAFLVPDGRATVTWSGALTIEIDGGSQWYVVYDEPTESVCVEPQSGPPNGVNDGLGFPIPVVSPGEPHQLRTRWLLRREQQAGRG